MVRLSLNYEVMKLDSKEAKKRYMKICELLRVNLDSSDEVQIKYFLELKKESFRDDGRGVKVRLKSIKI